MLRILVCLVSLCVAGVAVAQDVVGTWALDLASIENDKKIAKLPAEQRKKVLEMARTMLAKMTIEMKADGTATMNVKPGMSRAGTWAKDAKGVVTMTVDGKTKIVDIKGDRLEIADNETTLSFTRAGAGAKAPAAAAANVPLPEPLKGKWTVDAEATVAAAPKDRVEKYTRMAKRMTGMVLTLGAGTLAMDDGKRKRDGTFTVQRTSAAQTVIMVTESGRSRTEAMTLELKGKHLHATIDNDTLVFAR